MATILTVLVLLTVAAYGWAYWWLMRGLAYLGSPLPRTHPFGDGTACDGCDDADVFTKRGGGWYCRRCWEEIAA